MRICDRCNGKDGIMAVKFGEFYGVGAQGELCLVCFRELENYVARFMGVEDPEAKLKRLQAEKK